jgi:hypothetical protein
VRITQKHQVSSESKHEKFQAKKKAKNGEGKGGHEGF